MIEPSPHKSPFPVQSPRDRDSNIQRCWKNSEKYGKQHHHTINHLPLNHHSVTVHFIQRSQKGQDPTSNLCRSIIMDIFHVPLPSPFVFVFLSTKPAYKRTFSLGVLTASFFMFPCSFWMLVTLGLTKLTPI